jgi:hypothetical protein
MRVTLCKFCEYVCMLNNGRHSLIGLFESIVAPELPVDHPPMYLVVQMEFDTQEAGHPLDMSCVLIDADGKQLFSIPTRADIPRDPGGKPVKLFVQYFIPNLRIEKPGDYRLDVLMNGQKVAEELLPVMIARPQ